MKSKLLFLFLLLFQVSMYSQFDKILFKKGLTVYRDNAEIIPHVLALGDQNQDGYDDILMISDAEKKAMFFLGGSHMDTIPVFSFTIDTSFRKLLSMQAIDLNDDKDLDYVISYQNDDNTIIVKLFYGGSLLDTIPALVFTPPPGSSRNWGALLYVMRDFNGDERSELIITDSNIPFSPEQSQYGAWYFYNIGKKFNPNEYILMIGDSSKGVALAPIMASLGDLNGDGLTDISMLHIINNKYFERVFIPGNKNWDFTPVSAFSQWNQTFFCEHMEFIDDFNGDKKDDILMVAYGNKYPYWYYNSILYGSLPVDTIQDIGINTQNDGLNTIYSISPGDVNGDGYNDLLAMLQGTNYKGAKLFLGGKSRQDILPARSYRGGEEGFGRMLAKTGDVNGDGLADFCIAEITYMGIPKYSYAIAYIISGDSVGRDTTTSVKMNPGNIHPDDFQLFQPYPNPFNPVTTINWSLKKKEFITIKIYDALGKFITTVINEEEPPGDYRYIFNTSKYNLSSGVYIVEMKAGKEGAVLFNVAKKITFIK